MSADLDSSETKAEADMSEELEEAGTGVGGLDIVPIESHENLPSDGDAADFLLSNPKYHDCFLIVGNPENEKVETIGASSLHLIAQSPVLREKLQNNRSEEASESKLHVTEVSPSTFKLMLRFVYGGRLPQMTAIETAGLALCAHMFQIPRLVQKALKRLDPTSAEDVFPALVCVTFTNCPEMETKVAKIVQQETNRIVKTPDFVELDEDSVVFILKQNFLNIDELELWKSVVRWAENQVKKRPDKTIRDCLEKILGYVRFLSFTVEEILEHVLPRSGLTPEECLDLTLAVTKSRPLESSVLCKIQERRHPLSVEDVTAKEETENRTADETNLLQKAETVVSKPRVLKKPDYIVWNIVLTNFILLLIYDLYTRWNLLS